MKLLENYTKAVEELEEYFEIDNLNYYSIEIEDSFFTIFNNGEIGFADIEEDLKNQDRGYYQKVINEVIEKEELTLVLIDNDTGYDDYWVIFKTKNKRDY